VLLAVFGICRAATLPVGGWCTDRLGTRRVMSERFPYPRHRRAVADGGSARQAS